MADPIGAVLFGSKPKVNDGVAATVADASRVPHYHNFSEPTQTLSDGRKVPNSIMTKLS